MTQTPAQQSMDGALSNIGIYTRKPLRKKVAILMTKLNQLKDSDSVVHMIRHLSGLN